jgi:hypothetical protein
VSSFVRGELPDVLTAMHDLLTNDLFRGDVEFSNEVAAAIAEIDGGAWLVNMSGHVFEVVEPVMTVEQDVYGCHKGRACTDVPENLRGRFDRLIEARTAAGRGTDDRHHHWFYRLERGEVLGQSAHDLVFATLGSVTVADAAAFLAEAVCASSPHEALDLHVTLLPDRIRLRVDDDYGLGRTGQASAVFGGPGSSTRLSAQEYLDRRALRSGVVGGKYTCSLWADFARRRGDAVYLAQNHGVIPAMRIPAGAFVYRAEHHMAWVPIAESTVVGDRVRLQAADGYPLPSLAASDQVAVFVPAGAATR